MKLIRHRGWRIIMTQEAPWLLELANKTLDNQLKVKKVFNASPRSRVTLVEENGNDVIIKYPLEKNTRKWIRFTTLFRKGEAFKNIFDMEKLQNMGIRSTIPIMACEKRRFGMVVDSWLAYYFLEGRACNESDYDEVVKTLQLVHEKGIIHGDPQIQNFIYNEAHGVCVIDSKPNHNLLGKIREAYEFVYLAKSAPGIEQFIPIKTSLLYRIARSYDRFDRNLARFRRSVKSFIRLKKRT